MRFEGALRKTCFLEHATWRGNGHAGLVGLESPRLLFAIDCQPTRMQARAVITAEVHPIRQPSAQPLGRFQLRVDFASA